MKLTTLILASLASPSALASAPSTPSNVSTPLMAIPSNSSSQETNARKRRCNASNVGGLVGWFYDSWSYGPYECYGDDKPRVAWTMRYAYRSGGTENIHWKYTTDPNDQTCLPDWEWYAEDGNRLVTKIKGRTTLEGATGRLWCPLPVYRTGGLEGRQWAWCWCDLHW